MRATPVTGSFAAVGASPWVFRPNRGDFNLSLSGTFSATLALERSFNGVDWLPVTYADGTALSWSAPLSTILPEPEDNVVYRLNCTAYTSGTVSWRFSQ